MDDSLKSKLATELAQIVRYWPTMNLVSYAGEGAEALTASRLLQLCMYKYADELEEASDELLLTLARDFQEDLDSSFVDKILKREEKGGK